MAKPETVKRAIAEARRFIERAENHLKSRRPAYYDQSILHDEPKASGAMKRSSMDLSRVLADLRQGR